MTVVSAIESVRSILGEYRFAPQHEADLQAQVATVLEIAGLDVDREVLAERGRCDLFLNTLGAHVVLELKVAGSAPAVERQAQRYALTEGVDAVVVITTSNRLANELRRPAGETLGGKPFAVIALRAF